jgi:methylmalonyl-CoA/ethylmalonyl-CoA epimerase
VSAPALANAGPLHHVGIVVPSLARSVPFYRDVLGYAIGEEHALAEQRVRVVFVSKGDSRVELLEPTDAESGVARFLAERGRATLHHLCFEVVNLTATLDRLAAEGVELVDRSPRRGVEGMVAFLHPRAAGGVLVELLQRSR